MFINPDRSGNLDPVEEFWFYRKSTLAEGVIKGPDELQQSVALAKSDVHYRVTITALLFLFGAAAIVAGVMLVYNSGGSNASFGVALGGAMTSAVGFVCAFVLGGIIYGPSALMQERVTEKKIRDFIKEIKKAESFAELPTNIPVELLIRHRIMSKKCAVAYGEIVGRGKAIELNQKRAEVTRRLIDKSFPLEEAVQHQGETSSDNSVDGRFTQFKAGLLKQIATLTWEE